jgi:hypothetical protein
MVDKFFVNVAAQVALKVEGLRAIVIRRPHQELLHHEKIGLSCASVGSETLAAQRVRMQSIENNKSRQL